jgi:hypothetical protein
MAMAFEPVKKLSKFWIFVRNTIEKAEEFQYIKNTLFHFKIKNLNNEYFLAIKALFGF